MIVLDASVLIAFLDAEDEHHERAERLLVAVVLDDLAVSPLTLAAVLVGPARAGRLQAVTEALAELGVREVALPDDAARRLAGLRAETGLRLPDCCVLLTRSRSGPRLRPSTSGCLRPQEPGHWSCRRTDLLDAALHRTGSPVRDGSDGPAVST